MGRGARRVSGNGAGGALDAQVRRGLDGLEGVGIAGGGADALGPEVAELEDLLQGVDEVLRVLGGLGEIEEVVVDDGLRVGLEREVPAGRLLAEESAREQVAVGAPCSTNSRSSSVRSRYATSVRMPA